MASIEQLPFGSFQLSVKNRVLPKTLWATINSFEQLRIPWSAAKG
jgi:hypothetical protein